MSSKQHGWENCLVAYLRRCARSPFRPGELDCGLFTAGAVAVMTGKDYAKGLRYKTIETGLKQMQKRGFADHVEYTASLFDELPSPLYAQRGDIAALRDENGNPVLGIVQGEGIYVMTLDGLGLRPLSDSERAFRV